MSGVEIGIYSIFAILVLIQLGMHVAVALMAVSFFGVYLLKGKMLVAGALLSQAALDGAECYSFGVVPLFVLMGVLVGTCGLGRDIFDVGGQLFRKFKSGLGIATVFANAVFAAVNGTSIASASVFTKVAVPELVRQAIRPAFPSELLPDRRCWACLFPRLFC